VESKKGRDARKAAGDGRSGFKMLALGDKLSNMRAISRDYARLGDTL